MARTYVIADLHGRADLLAQALDKIHRRSAGTVVFLGDYIDRGPQSRAVIERLMAGPPRGWTWIPLQGNHEVMMLMTVRHGIDPDWWLSNGGSATMKSYGSRLGTLQKDAIPFEHLEWCERLQRYHVDKHRVFVHASVDPAVPLDRQNEERLQWYRYPGNIDVGYGDRHVVHGHDPVDSGVPIQLRHRTNLDVRAYRFGVLYVGVFDDARPGGPVELIEVRAK